MQRTIWKGLPTGFQCKCKKFHRFPEYVYAHWDMALTFKCPVCLVEYMIIRGLVIEASVAKSRYSMEEIDNA